MRCKYLFELEFLSFLDICLGVGMLAHMVALFEISGFGDPTAMSHGVGYRCGLDLALLRLWCRPAATVPIPPLAWKLPYATGAAIKRPKKKSSFGIPLWHNGLKIWCCHCSGSSLRFRPLPWNFHRPWVKPQNKYNKMFAWQ